MKYLKFILQDYKAIGGTVEIDVSKKSIIPVIGTNESGKTSILWGIFAFDYANDTMNDGRHLKNPSNLYKTTGRGSPTVLAEIEISEEEWKDVFNDVLTEDSTAADVKTAIPRLKTAVKKLAEPLKIKRVLEAGKMGYSFANADLAKFNNIAAPVIDAILTYTPYTLYFDDFRDNVPEEIEIVNPRDSWLSIIEQLFKKTDPGYSVHKLQGLDELTRRSVLGDVCKKLNEALAKEWEKFTLDEGARLDVVLQYKEKEGRPFLQLLIKENVEGNERFFGILDRSKGFFWFFNFVMKLEFNPKVRSMEDEDTIYLLDEPGSYLHSSAQTKLCEKLAFLSQKNVVIYCTHSHYLLDPATIPLSYIKIAKKSPSGSVRLIPLPEYNEEDTTRRSALQPIIDALQIKPFITDLDHGNIVITEGIYDYYVFEMFKAKGAAYNFLPAVNAQSVAFLISIAIGWRLNYVALWDNDDEGVKEKNKAQKFFGDKEAARFLLLPSATKKRKYILQNLFEGADMTLIKAELGVPKNASFEKVISMLFFSPKREEILGKVSSKTTSAVNHVYSKALEILGI